VYTHLDGSDRLGLYFATLAMLDRSLVKMNPAILADVLSAISQTRRAHTTPDIFETVACCLIKVKMCVDQDASMAMRFLAVFSTVHSTTTLATVRELVSKASALL
jgi:hypothetical protein